jgi:hypothetical protein
VHVLLLGRNETADGQEISPRPRGVKLVPQHGEGLSGNRTAGSRPVEPTTDGGVGFPRTARPDGCRTVRGFQERAINKGSCWGSRSSRSRRRR